MIVECMCTCEGFGLIGLAQVELSSETVSYILQQYLSYLLMSAAGGKGEQQAAKAPCFCIANAFNRMRTVGCFLCGGPQAPSGPPSQPWEAYDFYVNFAFRCEGCDKDVQGKFTLHICTYCFEPLEISIFSTAEEENITKQVMEKLQMLIPGVTLA